MRAVQYSAYGEIPTVVTTPDPDCPEDGAVIRVGATGVCRSDWHAWSGHDPVALPHVPGHEFAGVVAAVGPRVTRVRVGDRVTVPFVCGCGTLRVLPGRGRAGVPAADPARLHRPGARSPSSSRSAPPTRTWYALPDALDLVDRRRPGLPVRDRLPRARRARPGRPR